MEEPPKVKFRNGVHHFNKENIYGIESVEEACDILYYQLRECKRETNKKEKILKFQQAFSPGMGNWISKEYLIECMGYVDISSEDLLNYLARLIFRQSVDGDNLWRFHVYDWKWFLKLTGRTFLILDKEDYEKDGR